MRHGKAGKRLGRDSTLRWATIRDVAKATLLHQRVCTTKGKAKEARKLVDRLITLGKGGSLAQKRRAFSILCDHSLVSDLFNKISPRFKNRAGGYTRVISLSTRRGDNARLAYLELTEKEKVIISKPTSEGAAKKKTQPNEPAVTPKGLKPQAEPKAQPKDKQIKHAEHEHPAEPEKKQPFPKKDSITKDQHHTPADKIMGGIKKIFRKKQP